MENFNQNKNFSTASEVLIRESKNSLVLRDILIVFIIFIGLCLLAKILYCICNKFTKTDSEIEALISSVPPSYSNTVEIPYSIRPATSQTRFIPPRVSQPPRYSEIFPKSV